jgi:hypothetical protein
LPSGFLSPIGVGIVFGAAGVVGVLGVVVLGIVVLGAVMGTDIGALIGADGAAAQPLSQPVLQPLLQLVLQPESQVDRWNLAFKRSIKLGLAHGSQPQPDFLKRPISEPLNSGVPQAGLQAVWQVGAGAAQAGAQPLSHLPTLKRARILSSRVTRGAQESWQAGAGAAQPPQSEPAIIADDIKIKHAFTVKSSRGMERGYVHGQSPLHRQQRGLLCCFERHPRPSHRAGAKKSGSEVSTDFDRFFNALEWLDSIR